MAVSAVDERLLYEVAPPLMASGRPTVVAYLRQLIQDPCPPRWSPGLKGALRLAAVTYQVADRLVSDLGIAPQPPTPRRWRPKIERGWVSVPASFLMWGGVEARSVRPLPRTQAYLDDLPTLVVDRTLGWAPPVVMPFGRNGEQWVVGCHVSALLARQRRPDADIRVRRLNGKVLRNRTLADVCAGIVTVLEPLFRRYRRFLAQIAVDEQEAWFLTGYSRAQYFRIKEGADERKPPASGTVP